MTVENREQLGLLTTNQLFVGLVNAGVPPEVASEFYVHEGGHQNEHKRAGGKEGKGVSTEGSFGFYVSSNGRYYQVTAYYSPSNWDELSAQDKINIALANRDPSNGDLIIASEGRKELIREQQEERYRNQNKDQGIGDLGVEEAEDKSRLPLTEEELEKIKGEIITRVGRMLDDGITPSIKKIVIGEINSLGDVTNEIVYQLFGEVLKEVEIKVSEAKTEKEMEKERVSGDIYVAADHTSVN